MKNYLVVSIAALLLTFPALCRASTWNIDADHSNVGFKVRHLMVSNVKGVFGKVAGVVDVDDQDVTRSTARVTIDAGSVDTGVAKRDADLRSDHFLDVAKFPAMTFVSKSVAKSGEGRLRITGDLTLHGVTRTVVLDVEGPSQVVKDPMGNLRRGASAETRINRKDYGLTWNKALETGGVLVGDQVGIGIEVEMVKSAQ